MKNKTKIIITTSVFILIIVSFFVYTMISISNYSNIDGKRNADAVIVLGAGVSNGEPSPVFEERIRHSIQLYKNNYAKKIIFTGGISKGNLISDSQVAKDYAINNGVKSEDIFIEEKSTITQENLQYASAIVKDKSFESVIITSDPLHMKRSMYIAKDYNLNAYSSPTTTTKYKSLKTKIPFLARESFFFIGYKVYRLLGM